MPIKDLAQGLICGRLAGYLDYHRFPERKHAWGGPFNGQKSRAALFRAIMEDLSPLAIAETGTYLGTTTDFLAETGLPVYSVEGDPRAYGFAKARLRKRRNVTLLRGDSRVALAKLLDEQLRSITDFTLFFYLDAHWNADLPLAGELNIVFGRCPRAVVMVDDFEVPGDPGYGYDDYGPGKKLTQDYIAPVVAMYGLGAFYPATPATEESGERRGCIVLACDGVHGTALSSLRLLRPAGEEQKRVR